MDIHESLSDCSESSRGSECCLSSNTSTLSNLSDYGKEFLEIKKSINQESSIAKCKLKGDASISSPHRSYMQNGSHKNDIFDLEKKLPLSHNEKIEKLLQRNMQLEENLKAANDHIQRLIKICYQKDCHDSITLLEEKVLNLQKNNDDLNLQNSTLFNELNTFKHQKREIESDYKGLKTHYNELKLQLDAKEGCIVKLKDKIQEQHVDLQKALQNNVKLSHTVNSVSNELQHMTKSENWYKEELNRLQKEKGDLTMEVVEKNKIIANLDEKCGQLSLEINKWKCKYDEACLTLLKEKESILKQTETDNNKSVVGNDSLQVTTNLDIQRITQHYEMTIKDLTNEVLNIKLNFKNQQNSLDELTKQNSEMLVKYVNLDNLLKEKNSIIDKLESDEKDLKLKLDMTLNRELEHKTNLLHSKSIITKLETELTMKIQEKVSIEETVRKIKEQFQLLKSKYKNLKDELSMRDKEILQIQLQNQELLSMISNQKTSIQEKIQQTDIAISNLKEQGSEYTINKNDSQKNTNELEMRYLNTAENENYQNTFSDIKIENYPKVDKESTLCPEQKALENTCSFSENYKCVDDNITTSSEGKELTTVEPFNVDVVQKNVTNFVVNNYANLEPHNVSTAYIVMEYICKLCKIDDYSSILQTNFYNKSDNNSESINELFNKINKYFHFTSVEESLKDKVKKKTMKSKSILNKVEILEKKCKILENKTEESEGILLKLLKQGSNEEKVKHLQALLEVKIREQRDKGQRYEANYRTLLRKVKEHMKGRNTAEKRSLYLEEMYNNLSDECNSLKLQIHLKSLEIDELKRSVENQCSNYESIKPCRNELTLSSHCDKCDELELMKERVKEFEEILKSSEYLKETLLQETKVKEELVTALRKENGELLLKLSVLNGEHKYCTVKIENLVNENKQLSEKLSNREGMLVEAKSIIEKLKAELSVEKDLYSRACTENENLSKQIEKIRDRNAYLMKDIELSNSCLQQKDEELRELNLRKKQLESNWDKKDYNMQNVIIALKSQLQIFKNEVDGMRNEKFFLQRLCNDLKVALKIHVHHNKVLKEYIFCNMSKEKQKWSDVFNVASDFPCPVKYDDDYIERLLQASNGPVEETSLNDIQECLDALRKEINIIQKQIIEKNVR